MLGAGIVLPFITMAVGALFAMLINDQPDMIWGALIGFGAGCAFLVLIWVVFAIVKKWVDG